LELGFLGAALLVTAPMTNQKKRCAPSGKRSRFQRLIPWSVAQTRTDKFQTYFHSFQFKLVVLRAYNSSYSRLAVSRLVG